MIQKLRIGVLLLLHVLIFLHIFVFEDDIVGSIDFQEFFHAFIKHGILNAGAILVIIAFMTTLIFGRFFCGWACHFGAVQELSWFILKRMNIKPKTINTKINILELFPPNCLWGALTDQRYFKVIQGKVIAMARLGMHRQC